MSWHGRSYSSYDIVTCLSTRYLGLETMARLATNLSTHEYLDRRQRVQDELLTLKCYHENARMIMLWEVQESNPGQDAWNRYFDSKTGASACCTSLHVLSSWHIFFTASCNFVILVWQDPGILSHVAWEALNLLYALCRRVWTCVSMGLLRSEKKTQRTDVSQHFHSLSHRALMFLSVEKF